MQSTTVPCVAPSALSVRQSQNSYPSEAAKLIKSSVSYSLPISNAPFHKDYLSSSGGEMNIHRADVSRKFAPRIRNTFHAQGTEGSAYPSLQEKCEKLQEHIGAALASAAKAMDENICECLGCCGDGSKCMFATFQAPTASGPSGPPPK